MEKSSHRRQLAASMASAVASPLGAFADLCERTTSEILEEIAPSLLRIFSVAIDLYNISERVQMAAGTRVVIDDDGHTSKNS